MICGKWISLIFKVTNKFSILQCALSQEVKKVEFHVLMKIRFQSSNNQFLVELLAIQQKMILQTLSFLVIIVGFKPKLYLLLICSTMINLHHKLHKLGKEMFSSTQFINIMPITAHLLRSTENISQSLKKGFFTLKEENQSIWMS